LGDARSNECVRPLFRTVPARHGGRLEPTHPDHVRGILDFLDGFYEGSIVIAEGVGSSPTGNMHDGYELYGLTSLPHEYKDVTLIDISIGRTVVVQRKKVFLNSLKDTEWKDF